jgi:hypothetical protein
VTQFTDFDVIPSLAIQLPALQYPDCKKTTGTGAYARLDEIVVTPQQCAVIYCSQEYVKMMRLSK